MHALNNYLQGPYVTRTACRTAAAIVSTNLSQVGGSDAEDYARHLHPETGWLSIDVINVLGATLGIEVEGTPMTAISLLQGCEVDCLMNCNNQHWTVLQQRGGNGPWLHTDSIAGSSPHSGRAQIERPHQLRELLAGLQVRYGRCSLHRIKRCSGEAGLHFLETEGMQAHLPAEAVLFLWRQYTFLRQACRELASDSLVAGQ